jgi:glycine C-acetyltransferase
MTDAFLQHLRTELDGLKSAGLYKSERVITSKQAGEITVASGQKVLNFCANNYLGLADNEELAEAAKKALDRYGYGMASVRFICGTQEEHKQLEARISSFLGMEDTILYSSCFDANGGLFETLMGEEDAIISDALNHASIIDGIRLCKAERHRYPNGDMNALEAALQATAKKRLRLIATDGVSSVGGVIARLGDICDLADRYGALVMVDDSHATGFIGQGGKGTPELRQVMGRIDILTGTLGKALGGAAGGYTAARREIVGWLRQRSRPYLFSNSIPPVIAAGTLRVLDLVEDGDALRASLRRNTMHFRQRMSDAGFHLVPGEHPIAPVMLGDAALAGKFAENLLARGVYVIGFSYPVVPLGKARIRAQMSAGHSVEQLERAIEAFIAVGRELGVIR